MANWAAPRPDTSYPAANTPGIFHGLECLIDDREPATDRLVGCRLSSDDAMTCQKLVCDSRAPLGGRGLRRTGGVHGGPTPLSGWWHEPPGPERGGRPRFDGLAVVSLMCARSACSVSFVTMPFQTRSHKAATVSPGKPPPVPS